MVVIRGCNYSPNHFSLAYPLSSSPHGGIWKTPPQFYQDYQEEAKRHKREREGRDREERERESSDFFRKFFGFFGFFGFESEPETIEPDYPYSVFGLKRSASGEDMKKAYRKEVLKAHPDRGGTPELFRKVRAAWECFTESSL
tara:strand:+ start:64 stop:492 length:429 start_codon:yes stop_codon:yes gene_type:complete